MFMSTLKSVCVVAVIVGVACLGVVHASSEALTSDIVAEVDPIGSDNQPIPPTPTPDPLSRPRGSLKSRAHLEKRDVARNEDKAQLARRPPKPIETAEIVLEESNVALMNATTVDGNTVLNETSSDSERQGSCSPGYWYSSFYGQCFDKNGNCLQYDNTDASTCTNGIDNIQCEWDSSNQWCNPQCSSGQWLSTLYGRCFDKNGNCFQYDDTDASTCTNGNDNIQCEWDSSNLWCNPQCSSGQWLSTLYGQCFDKNGNCFQYDGTDASTCTNGNDNIQCGWDSSNLWCDPV
ncbi:hypothetical protein M9435_001810 [Picochlorum sp. BPE23]|nr:hypothetical protein M9435_001810 [Picochlorum sp. BPE23]